MRRLKLCISSNDLIRFTNLWRKFIDPFNELTHYPDEMFVKSPKLMIAAAALKRVAWHVILLRRDFRTS